MRPHVAAVYAFARVADDIADEGAASAGERQARLHAWQERLHDAVGADRRRSRVEPRRGSDLRRARPLDSVARSAALALRRSAERVRSGYHDDSLRLVARRARLLPAIGESGRPPRAAHRRLPRRGARSIVGRAVHGAAADELLAGLRPRLARRPPLRAARRLQPPPARGKIDSPAPVLPPAWTRALGACVAVTRARFAEGRASATASRGRLRFELRLTWLGGRRILDRVDAQRGGAPAAPAGPRRGRRPGAARGGCSTWKGAAA